MIDYVTKTFPEIDALTSPIDVRSRLFVDISVRASTLTNRVIPHRLENVVKDSTDEQA